ncbi:hypothetical protein BGW36DRAFT_387423 [Talaromyces proteolyticus]|uniref:Short-chain dehydrogenase n=1 Tax=Talaromyces proteolyticus TaxID=1131652 RepID=A0AAD4PWE7_9EURO|nr:uncharacterized protein BGW36DRAFT_387423 [Talaromyces proteolyticus]KAH8692338.1 hypothetical protein BGW36DRAFT_387423 [Talaromyces proteolyticus]
MPVFDATTTSEQVVDAYRAQVQGRTFVITGGSQPSIGSSLATSLAKASPAHILIASRTAAKVEPVLAAIREIDSSVKATFVQVDLSNYASVRKAAGEILNATASKIDVLINSAGNMAIKEYTLDAQGIEIQLSANHLGHFLLTNLLVPALSAAAASDKSKRGARVVNLSSNLWTAYGQAKTANILFSYALTQRLEHQGITAFAAHPGSNLDTNLGSHLVLEDYDDIFEITKRNTGQDFVFDEPRFKSYAQIGATPLAAALNPDIVTAGASYLQNCQIVEPIEHARDAEAVEKLWDLSEELVGQKFPY